MRKVALLPTHGDPFMLKHFLVNYERVWKDEVDELVVLVSGQPDTEVIAYMQSETEKAGATYLLPEGGAPVMGDMGHGLAMRILAEANEDADAFVFFEGDSRVCRSGAVAEALHRIEDGEVCVGSPRVSMTNDLANKCRGQLGGVTATNAGDDGYGLWPCFLFVRRDVLLNDTDRNFSAAGWQPGEVVPGLNRTFEQEECADTFGSAAIQLRAKHRIESVPQWKGPWGWEGWLNKGYDVCWFHTGSLSSWGHTGGLTLDGDAPLMDGTRRTDEHELLEWAHRCAWWERFERLYGDELPAKAANYRRNMARLIEVIGVERWHISKWTGVLDRLVTWDESSLR